jgi:hypothetical protein
MTRRSSSQHALAFSRRIPTSGAGAGAGCREDGAQPNPRRGREAFEHRPQGHPAPAPPKKAPPHA